MLFPIVQYIWQQVSPQAAQFFSSPAANQFIKQLISNPGVSFNVMRGTIMASEQMSHVYESLSVEEKKRLHDVMIWIAKDMGGDFVSAATGLPIGPLVQLGLEKLLPDENGPK